VLRVARKLGVTVEQGRVVVGRRSTKREMTLGRVGHCCVLEAFHAKSVW
jgi:hypothetical protein